ncbi:MAG: 7-cyano-7-deazaguanine synthase QueC [Phycisphaerales bacterium]|nr:7-cyano-7-deazaguanine synthase QueC [Phycisphaerales bacterium]
MTHHNAVVCVSGGLDSATVLAMASAEFSKCLALSFDYGQRHRHELACAAALCASMGHEHRIIQIDPRIMSGSALTGGGDVPKTADVEIGQGIPDTYVPARNTVFLAMGLAVAEVEHAEAVYIGANAVDYSGYPDCRPEFIEAFDRLATLATRSGVEGRPIRILAPLLSMTKADIIREGVRLGVDYGLTSSCYDPGSDGGPCQMCESCRLRAKGFEDADRVDPLVETVR